jgi:hypothetical protein
MSTDKEVFARCNRVTERGIFLEEIACHKTQEVGARISISQQEKRRKTF